MTKEELKENIEFVYLNKFMDIDFSDKTIEKLHAMYLHTYLEKFNRYSINARRGILAGIICMHPLSDNMYENTVLALEIALNMNDEEQMILEKKSLFEIYQKDKEVRRKMERTFTALVFSKEILEISDYVNYFTETVPLITQKYNHQTKKRKIKSKKRQSERRKQI